MASSKLHTRQVEMERVLVMNFTLSLVSWIDRDARCQFVSCHHYPLLTGSGSY